MAAPVIPEGFELDVQEPAGLPEGFQLDQPEAQESAGMSNMDYIKGGAESLLKGATLGFSEEIESIIAAAVAAPFISDKTFSQLMVDARKSLREDQEKFREAAPVPAFINELAGGAATGGAGMAKTAGAQTLKQAVGRGAATGAGIGAIAGEGYADADEFLSSDTVIGAGQGLVVGSILGAAIPVALAGASKAIQRVFKKPEMSVFDEAGKFTDEALNKIDEAVNTGAMEKTAAQKAIKEAVDNGAILSPEQIKRYNLFKERGVTPLKADITQATDDFANQQSALKRSGPVANVATEQEQQLIKLANDGIENIGPVSQDIGATNATVYNAIDRVVSGADEAVTRAYQSAKQAAQGLPRVEVKKLLDVVNDNRGNEKISGGVISSLRQTLKNKGLLKAGTDLNVNKRGGRLSEIKKITVQEAEEIRQSMNSLFDSVTPQGRRLIRSFKNALDDDVEKSVGSDIFKEAREAKTKVYGLIEKSARNRRDKSKGSILEDVIDNKIPEEKILQKLLTGRDDDFAKIKEFLTKDAGPDGAQAFANIKAQVLRNALDKATGTMAKREGGQPVFNVRLFRNEFKGIQNTKKYNELFNADERKLISDIIEIGNLRIPISSVQQGKGPSELAVSELRKEIMRKIPIVGDKAQGLMDAVSNMKLDRDLLQFADKTAEVIR